MFEPQPQSDSAVRDLRAHPAETISVIVYRSVAVAALSDSEIQALARSAQARNRAEGLTGVLLYDRGRYFQWLEGSPEALGRVWNSISHDPRHDQIEVLRNQRCSDRTFEGWDLRVITETNGSIDAAVAALNLQGAALRRVVVSPPSITSLSLAEVVSSLVVPGLRYALAGGAPDAVPNRSTAHIWHAEPGSGARLAAELMSSNTSDARWYIDSLLDQGAGFNGLYQEVFETAQRQLGQLSDEDQCDDFKLMIALTRLQLEIRRVNAIIPRAQFSISNHSVLLCPQPNEGHRVGLCMSSEVFSRGGWHVDCEYPADSESLDALVRANWFDVLHLSQSRSLRRDSHLAAMRAIIDSARIASLNPSLIVIVDGRTFVERAQSYRTVHANAMISSALNTVSVADRLLLAGRSLTPMAQVSAS